jgi:hypothetical protein
MKRRAHRGVCFSFFDENYVEELNETRTLETRKGAAPGRRDYFR